MLVHYVETLFPINGRLFNRQLPYLKERFTVSPFREQELLLTFLAKTIEESESSLAQLLLLKMYSGPDIEFSVNKPAIAEETMERWKGFLSWCTENKKSDIFKIGPG